MTPAKILIDHEEMEDFLVKVERSFGIKFQHGELEGLSQISQLHQAVLDKLKLTPKNDCSTQQAFYQIREAIAEVISTDIRSLTTTSNLNSLLPKRQRRQYIKEIEKLLGIQLNMLRPAKWVEYSFAAILVTSLFWLIIDWKIGIYGICFSMIGLYFANKYGKELKEKTLGELGKKMTRENYLQSRSNSSTYNPLEIERLITEWFCVEFDLKTDELEAKLEFKLL